MLYTYVYIFFFKSKVKEKEKWKENNKTCCSNYLIVLKSKNVEQKIYSKMGSIG